MIPLDFYLFWGGGNISYLRYLTFKTLRYFHPNSKIKLYLSKRHNKHIHKWDVERQDFEGEIKKDYKEEIRKLGVEIIEMDYFSNPNYCVLFQNDLFRFWILHAWGGIYADTDQLFLKPLDTLPLKEDLIYSQFSNADRPVYAPTGIIGCSKGNEIAKKAMKTVNDTYSNEVYNSSGPIAWETVLTENEIDGFNAPYQYFYPINCSSDVGQIYDGSYKIEKDSYCLHLYLGHPLSQEFNKTYTEELAKTSNDTISRFIRGLKSTTHG